MPYSSTSSEVTLLWLEVLCYFIDVFIQKTTHRFLDIGVPSIMIYRFSNILYNIFAAWARVALSKGANTCWPLTILPPIIPRPEAISTYTKSVTSARGFNRIQYVSPHSLNQLLNSHFMEVGDFCTCRYAFGTNKHLLNHVKKDYFISD